jgi:hypothetical protein
LASAALKEAILWYGQNNGESMPQRATSTWPDWVDLTRTGEWRISTTIEEDITFWIERKLKTIQFEEMFARSNGSEIPTTQMQVLM